MRADIAVMGRRFAEIGRLDGMATRAIDASGLVVAPRFIDPHTHCDAQICWDPVASYSSWHGVISIVRGKCGVGIAPCCPESYEIVTWDLVNVQALCSKHCHRDQFGLGQLPRFYEGCATRA